ncbi:MAG: hypothetical protein LBH77_05905 [Tannerella sp.]|jgi:hypothetical protein|nr:hypothetical protein [Tannerella sp.]
MKKITLHLFVILACIAGFTSCLEGGGNRETNGVVGILDIGNSTYVIKTLGGDIYAPELATYVGSGKMNLGSGYYISYEIDWDLPENSQSMIAASGYYTVSILAYYEAEKYSMDYYLTDTSTVQTNEMVVSAALLSYENGGINDITNNFVFMTHHVKCPQDMKLTWNLSYDYDKGMTPTEEGGKRYYDLFLRATKLNDSEKADTDAVFFNSYYVGDYVRNVANREKELLGSNYGQNSTFTLRIHYVSEIKDDKLVWKHQELAYWISPFVSSQN